METGSRSVCPIQRQRQKKVLKEQDHSQAAVCSAYAAQVYGLSVLAEDINDETNNVTRFIIVTNQKIFTPDASKSVFVLNFRTRVDHCIRFCRILFTMT